jgi:hypothetical protein
MSTIPVNRESSNGKPQVNCFLVFASCLLFCVLFLPFSASAQSNIVQNGNFTSASTTQPGWTGQNSWSSDGGVNGGPCVALTGGISQMLTTVPGQTYELQFSADGLVPGLQGSPPWGIEAQVGSQSTDYPLNTSWIVEKELFTASGSQTDLSFYPLSYCPGLDAVSVIAVVPEPPIVTLIIASAAMTMGHRHLLRRKARSGNSRTAPSF